MTADRWSVVCRRLDGCRQSPRKSWDEATNTAPWHKSIDLQFLGNLDVPDWGWCTAEHADRWGRIHYCDRPEEHTGRHLALSRLRRYPVAVWS